MNVIKATLLVFLAGLSEFATACSSNEELGCAHQAGYGENLYIPDGGGCLESKPDHYCCRKGVLVNSQDYSLSYAKGAAGCRTDYCTLSIFSSSCFTHNTFINSQPVNEQIPESKSSLPLYHLQNDDRIQRLELAVVRFTIRLRESL
ncbi:hypothetical protein Pst134EA_024634 [Puccinia striiformis f. sp. tritici]|uniref:Hydrophobin n=1 Tax=Puccinia striiformis f. sp. tritici PST-78 TaxID=1165861 RepID=A0A0L0VMD3_9BASI|nr:hypothetical protein Pst134EA_024634 [Puccinia striiformis f. sp. tritici]KAH9453769.1 hypothetical protein Pst134EA_024634 [Puccinia striiformis f. sp. tritici]KNF00438.1 hypothetical protein PSTG_06366 [Puccinia striiformis f. sp. tritici PST-78]